jgi:hypothetical protein
MNNNNDDGQRQEELSSPDEESLVHQSQPERPPLANDPRKLLHESHVHKIELETQNDQLHRVQAEQKDSWILYRDL